MVRIIVIGVGIAAAVVGGILFKRTLGTSVTAPSWPGMPKPRLWPQKPLRQADGHEVDNGVVYRD